MGENDQGKLHGISEGGVAGIHKPAKPFKILVAPSTGEEFNTIILGLRPVGCFRVDDVRFAFDSSFIVADLNDPKKDVRAELKLLVDLLEVIPDSPLSVFGHADPVGNDEYNKQLSGRRATVVYALLICQAEPEAAVALWKQVAKAENWGKAQRTAMQEFTELPVGTLDDVLFKTYMQKLTPAELQLRKENFIAQGADPAGKGDYQGCSEFNPVLVLSKQKTDKFEKTHDEQGRNDANARNRRVLILLYPKGSKVDPSLWPCPTVKQPIAGCVTRFFVKTDKEESGDERRKKQLPDKDRVIEEDKKMYACRFYHRQVIDSICENPVTFVRVRLYDAQARPLPFASCVYKLNGELKADRATGKPPSPAGVTAANTPGTSLNEDKESKAGGYILLKVEKVPATVTIWWSRAKRTDNPASPLPIVGTEFANDYKFEFKAELFINFPEDEQQASSPRLKNLGYVLASPDSANIRAFQTDYKKKFSDITEDGTFNQPTVDALRVSHDTCDLLLKPSSQIEVKR